MATIIIVILLLFLTCLCVLNIIYGYGPLQDVLESPITSTEDDHHLLYYKNVSISILSIISRIGIFGIQFFKEFDYSIVEDRSIYHQLTIVSVSTFLEAIDVHIDMRMNDFCMWLRRCEFMSWSTFVIISEFQRRFSTKNQLALGDVLVSNCIETFEKIPYWSWILLSGQLVIGLFPYPIIALAIINFLIETINVDYSSGFSSLGRVGITILKYVLINRFNIVVLMDAYATVLPNWAPANAFSFAVLSMRVNRGLISWMVFILFLYI